uniref:KRAB-related domain-containing protein n=3 Tax=Clastoptera arizonana TaxID=38151 RepID=A0A1B6CT40_9HEMI
MNNSMDDLKLYFSSEDWRSMSDYEKQSCLNIMENYNNLVNLGFKAAKPYFMLTNSKIQNKSSKTTENINILNYPSTSTGNRKSCNLKINIGSNNRKRPKEVNLKSNDLKFETQISIKRKEEEIKVNNYVRQSLLEELAKTGNKKFFQTKPSQSQIEIRNPSKRLQKSGNKLFTEVEQRRAVTAYNLLDTAIKLIELYNNKGINVLKKLKKLVEIEKTTSKNKEATTGSEEKYTTIEEHHTSNSTNNDCTFSKVGVKSFTSRNNQSNSRRYPKRNVPVKDYKEEETLDDDQYIFCDDCGVEYSGDCPEHGPFIHLTDVKVLKNKSDLDRAIKTTPPQLQVDESEIRNGGKGVWTKCAFPSRVLFGPYDGTKCLLPDKTGYSWR